MGLSSNGLKAADGVINALCLFIISIWPENNEILYNIYIKAVENLIGYRINRAKICTPSTHIHDRVPSWFGMGTPLESDGVKLVLWTQASLFIDRMQSCKVFFSDVNEIPSTSHI